MMVCLLEKCQLTTPFFCDYELQYIELPWYSYALKYVLEALPQQIKFRQETNQMV